MDVPTAAPIGLVQLFKFRERLVFGNTPRRIGLKAIVRLWPKNEGIIDGPVMTGKRGVAG